MDSESKSKFQETPPTLHRVKTPAIPIPAQKKPNKIQKNFSKINDVCKQKHKEYKNSVEIDRIVKEHEKPKGYDKLINMIKWSNDEQRDMFERLPITYKEKIQLINDLL